MAKRKKNKYKHRHNQSRWSSHTYAKIREQGRAKWREFKERHPDIAEERLAALRHFRSI